MSESPGIESEFPKFNKKVNDLCEYDGLVLKNGLRIMIVKDPSANIASVSLCLAAGNLRSPVNFDGLAHLVEHLIIFQTLENCLDRKFFKYIGKYGGDCNAVTDHPTTTYFFRVPSVQLMDSFKQFYSLFTLKPENSFTNEMFQYELSALDSEFKETMSTHDQRRLRTIQLSGNPAHPGNRFYKGNLEKLPFGNEVKQKCIEFVHVYYRTADMNISIISNHDCQEVKQLILATFANMKSTALPPFPTNLDLYTIDSNSTTIPEIVTMCTDGPDLLYRLELMFFSCEDKALDFLIYLLNHRGQGSLLYELRTKLKFDTPKSGAACKEYGSFCFGLTRIEPFTEEEKVSAVVMFMQYVKKLKDLLNQGDYDDLESIFNQMNEMDYIQLNYGDCRGLDFAKSLNGDLNRNIPFTANYFVTSTQNVPTFNQTFIAEFLQALDKLDLDRLHLIEITNNVPFGVEKLRDEVYGFDYAKLNRLSHEAITSRLDRDIPPFCLSTYNEFVPDRDQLRKSSNEGLKYRSQPNYNITKSQRDDCFFVHTRYPLLKIAVSLHSATSEAPLTDDQFAFFKLFVDQFMNNNSLIDPARCANIEFDIQVYAYGIQVIISGFKDKLNAFVCRFLREFCDCTTHPGTTDELEHLKKAFAHEANYPGLSVDELLLMKMQIVIGLKKVINCDMTQLTSQSVATVMREFLSKCAIKLFVCGSTSEVECNELRQMCEHVFKSTFPSWASQTQPKVLHQEVKLDPSQSTLFVESSPDFVTNGYLVFYQIVSRQIKDFALLSLLKAFLDVDFIEWFRFSEKHPPIGYSSELYQIKSSHTIGLALVMQPDVAHSYSKCFSMTTQLMDHFQGTLNKLEDASLKTKKDCLSEFIRDKIDLNAFDYFWSMIKFNSDFVDTTNLIKDIQSITKQELVTFFEKYFTANSAQSRRLLLSFRSTKVKHAQEASSSTASEELVQEKVRRVMTNIDTFIERSDKC